MLGREALREKRERGKKKQTVINREESKASRSAPPERGLCPVFNVFFGLINLCVPVLYTVMIMNMNLPSNNIVLNMIEFALLHYCNEYV